MIEGIEQVGIDTAKEGYGIRIPTPPKVVGESVEGLETGRQMGKDRESPDRTVRHERPQHPGTKKGDLS